MTTSASIPSTADAYASACAWLPAEIEITPRLLLVVGQRGELVQHAARLERPGALKELRLEAHVGADSSLESVADVSSGVRCSRSPMRSRAR